MVRPWLATLNSRVVLTRKQRWNWKEDPVRLLLTTSITQAPYPRAYNLPRPGHQLRIKSSAKTSGERSTQNLVSQRW